MSLLSYKTISDLNEAERIWKALSPNKVIYDDWNFRYAYYQFLNYPLHFYVAFSNDEPVAVLPLMWNLKYNCLDFFAGVNYMEYNQVFYKEGFEECRAELLLMPEMPYRLEDMDQSMASLPGVTYHEDTYSREIKDVDSVTTYLNQFLNSKERYNLKKASGLTVEVRDGNIEDLDLLIQFNKERFGEKSSFYTRPSWKEFHYEIAEKFDSILTVLSHDQKIVAVGLSIVYNNIFFDINAGRDINYPSLGKLIALAKLEKAIQLKADRYDAGTIDFGWKEDFGLEKKPLYILERK